MSPATPLPPLNLVTFYATVMLAGLVAYGVLGGADFGGGIWDLLARGPRRDAQRAAIARAMGPVWEANHVWLIFVVVLLFTGFPPAYALLSVAFFIPLHLALLGIILRGVSFVFRSHGAEPDPARDRWGRLFGISSAVTPFLLGLVVGAISSGEVRIRNGQVVSSAWTPWLSAASLAIGLLAFALCAYLAAVYLTVETEGELREDFRRRALAAWGGVAVVGAATLPVLVLGHHHLPWSGLSSPTTLVVVAAGVAAALVSLAALLARRFQLARAGAVAEVAVLLAGWGAILEYPYLIYPDLTLTQAAAPAPVLRFTLGAVAVGLTLLLPSLWYLFHVFQAPAVARGGDDEGGRGTLREP